MWMHANGNMWFWGPVMMVLWVALIALAVWWVARGLGVGRRTPRQVLEDRYARGEISTEEYRERVDHLG